MLIRIQFNLLFPFRYLVNTKNPAKWGQCNSCCVSYKFELQVYSCQSEFRFAFMFL